LQGKFAKDAKLIMGAALENPVRIVGQLVDPATAPPREQEDEAYEVARVIAPVQPPAHMPQQIFTRDAAKTADDDAAQPVYARASADADPPSSASVTSKPTRGGTNDDDDDADPTYVWLLLVGFFVMPEKLTKQNVVQGTSGCTSNRSARAVADTALPRTKPTREQVRSNR
jgi:hypothetical protein